jgi:hypothetical protein
MSQKNKYKIVSICLYLISSASVAIWLGPGFLEHIARTRRDIPDFFQEYASARNWREGIPIYERHEVTIPRYLGRPMHPTEIVGVNAHPPSSVLLALPLTGLDFDTALVVWNTLSLGFLAASLGLIARGLRCPSSPTLYFSFLAMLLLCSPLWVQVHHGQLNLVLLLLITAAWSAERSGRSRWAGILLALATVIKLYPAFLLAYFAVRRRTALVAWSAATLLVVTAITAAILGVDCFARYGRDVLPEVGWFRVAWKNASFLGFWSRLFDPLPGYRRDVYRANALLYSPWLARAATIASSLAVVAILVSLSWRHRAGIEADRTFGVAITTMLLISPVAWDHYFLLLFIPLTILARDLLHCGTKEDAVMVAGIVVALWVAPERVWSLAGLDKSQIATPADSLSVLSIPYYALLGLFAMGVASARRPEGDGPASGRSSGLPIGDPRGDGTPRDRTRPDDVIRSLDRGQIHE